MVLNDPNRLLCHKSKHNITFHLPPTYGDTLRSTPTWNMGSIFNGNRDDAGHGWCCEATEWAYPRELYNPDVEVEMDDKSFYNTSNSTYYKVGADTKTII